MSCATALGYTVSPQRHVLCGAWQGLGTDRTILGRASSQQVARVRVKVSFHLIKPIQDSKQIGALQASEWGSQGEVVTIEAPSLCDC